MFSNRLLYNCCFTIKNSIQCSYRVKAKNDVISSYKYSKQATFNGEKDRFNGIIVDLAKEKFDQQNFMNILEGSINAWREKGSRCLWFKVHIKYADLVPILAQKGFTFHHARDDSVVMYKWLPTDCEANLPPASHTNLGVGAMVFNKDDKMLAISEKSYDYPHWKLPGGYVERGENIVDAAIREVKEETDIDCVFESLVTFRHTHNMTFGNSDIYVLVRMKAITEDIVIATREIQACKWMDVEEYVNHPHVHAFNRLILKKALEYRDKKIKLNIAKKTVQWSTLTREMSYLLVEELK